MLDVGYAEHEMTLRHWSSKQISVNVGHDVRIGFSPEV